MHAVNILSVNVARPQKIEYGNRTVETSIFKRPVQGPVAVHREHLAGNEQAYQEVHGGRYKAVYAYSHDHYGWWREQLGLDRLDWGHFGENLTVAGLQESEIRIGDRLRCGQVLFQVTGPRIPCQNLAVRFDREDMPARFTASARCGIYLEVLETGKLQAGDEMELEEGAERGPAIEAFFRSFSNPLAAGARAVLEKAVSLRSLDPALQKPIAKRLRALEKKDR